MRLVYWKEDLFVNNPHLTDIEYFRIKHGHSKRRYKSPSFCHKCGPAWFQMEYGWGHESENCRNPPFCDYHEIVGHLPTDKCKQRCSYCMKFGHNMRHCRKLKNCNLCGKLGHNPYSCWKYGSLREWANRARELNRCMECLTLCTTETNRIDMYGCANYFCKHCGAWRTYWNPEIQFDKINCKESQTEENTYIDQESQIELQEAKAIIENQRRQIEELNNKILSLENKWENSNATIDNLDWKVQSITKEKEQELQKVNKLDSMFKEKEMELRKLQEQIDQKD